MTREESNEKLKHEPTPYKEGLKMNDDTFVFKHEMTMESDWHMPTKPLKNKIVFYKGKYTTKFEITLIPTIGLDINQPQISMYRAKNLTIRIEWLCFHLYFGWRQTYPR